MTITTYGLREELVNNWTSALNGGISDSATTLVVFDGSGLPTSGYFRVAIEDELILCNGRSGNSLFVEARGIEGTSAAAHSSATNMSCVLTAGGLQRWLLDQWGSGFSEDDAESYPLRRVLDEDGNALTSSDFTWLNQGTATIADVTDGGFALALPSENSHQVRGMYRSVPSTPFHVTTKLWLPVDKTTGVVPTGTHGGLFLRESSTGELYLAVMRHDNTTAFWRMTSVSAFSAGVDTGLDTSNQPLWIRITDDGTDVRAAFSLDGNNWTRTGASWFQEGRTAFMAGGPDQVGFYGSSGTADASVPFVFETYVIEEFA